MAITSIGMFAFPNMQLLDFIGPYDFFTAAPGVEVNIIGRSSDAFVTVAGMAIQPKYGIRDVPKVDVLFVPGGIGINDLLSDDLVLDCLARAGQHAQFVT